MSKPSRAKVKALKLSTFLQSIIETPPDYAHCKTFAMHLRSQGSMAKFSWPELGMEPVSLNALKSASSMCFDDGFLRIDKLRLTAVERLKEYLSPVTNSDKRNKPSLLKKISELEESKQRLEGNLMILTQALRLSIGLCEKYVRLTKKPEYREAFSFEKLEILEMASYSEKR